PRNVRTAATKGRLYKGPLKVRLYRCPSASTDVFAVPGFSRANTSPRRTAIGRQHSNQLHIGRRKFQRLQLTRVDPSHLLPERRARRVSERAPVEIQADDAIWILVRRGVNQLVDVDVHRPLPANLPGQA